VHNTQANFIDTNFILVQQYKMGDKAEIKLRNKETWFWFCI